MGAEPQLQEDMFPLHVEGHQPFDVDKHRFSAGRSEITLSQDSTFPKDPNHKNLHLDASATDKPDGPGDPGEIVLILKFSRPERPEYHLDRRGDRHAQKPPTSPFEPTSGLEPETARLQVGCATNCAMSAGRRLGAGPGHNVSLLLTPP